TYTKTEADNLLATKHNLITTSTYLAVSSLTAQTTVSAPSLTATTIDFLAADLTIKPATANFMSMSSSTGVSTTRIHISTTSTA
ncbi:MAG: hypothetical protein ACKPKO_58030, partial [Candidatus Fonsibacter sp.]